MSLPLGHGYDPQRALTFATHVRTLSMYLYLVRLLNWLGNDFRDNGKERQKVKISFSAYHQCVNSLCTKRFLTITFRSSVIWLHIILIYNFANLFRTFEKLLRWNYIRYLIWFDVGLQGLMLQNNVWRVEKRRKQSLTFCKCYLLITIKFIVTAITYKSKLGS